jgi:hypothetical protein
MRKTAVAATLLVVTLVVAGASFARGDGKRSPSDHKGSSVRASLDGYQETPSISTAAAGDFSAQIDAATIRFTLRWTGLEGGNASAAHLHLGQKHTSSAVIAWICGGGGKPACPTGNGTVEGTIVASDVQAIAAQGIAAGEFAELVRAIRAGAVYVNVHNATYAGGEIRGQLRSKGRANDDDD